MSGPSTRGRKPKTPLIKQAKFSNPYNNAGKKIKASSRGPVSYENARDIAMKKPMDYRTNSGQAAARGAGRAATTQDNLAHTMRQSDSAREGMYRKNAQAKAKTQYKRLVKESPAQYNYRSEMSRGAQRDYSAKAPPKVSAAKSGVGDYAKYNDVTSRMGGKSPSMYAGAAGGVAGASLATKLTAKTVLQNPAVDAAVVAGTVGYAVGTGINRYTKLSSKIAEKFAPKYDPGVYKYNKDSGQAYKVKRKK